MSSPKLKKLHNITAGWQHGEKLKNTGDVNILRENAAAIASMPPGYLATTYKAAHANGLALSEAEFNEIINAARVDAKTGDATRRVVQVNDRSLDKPSADAISAIEAMNNPPVVLRRGGELASVQSDDDGHTIIRRHDQFSLRVLLARVADYMNVGRSVTKCSPPPDLVNYVLHSGEGSFPMLTTVTALPIIDAAGRVHAEPGYVADVRTFYQPEKGFQLGQIPANPTQDDARTAGQYIYDELLGEFPYESEADRANALAVAVTIVLRAGQRMKVPLFTVDAPKSGSGKSLLSSCYGVLATGREPAVVTVPENEAEMRKTITSLLDKGTPIVPFDNLSRSLRSGAFASVLTSDDWTDRLLGRTETITVPNQTIWLVTGNNVQASGEIARRTCRIRLDPKTARPEKRTGFKRADEELVSWLKLNRGAVVAAALTMIKAWICAGKPTTEVPTFGSFNRWAQTVGCILAHAGVSGFLGNIDAIRVEADEESAEWEQFLTRWAIYCGDTPVSASSVLHTFQENKAWYALPDDLDPDGIQGSAARRLGKALAKKVGTRYGERELMVERCHPDTHSKVGLWRVQGKIAGLQTFSHAPPK